MTKAPVSPAKGNQWLSQFRKWHSWGGLFLSVFILLVAVTGILLNHKDFFFHGEKRKVTGQFRTTTDVAAVPITLQRVLALAHEHYGDAPLEKVELKDENGQMIYKVSQGHGEEIRIDAHTGAVFSKYGASLAADQESHWHWAKIVDDLHTGKIFGSVGKLVVDLTSGVIIALTLTGIYLWGVPILHKRENARKRQENSRPSALPLNAARRGEARGSCEEPAGESEPIASPTESRPRTTNEILAAARRGTALSASTTE
jgi:uncharacterized iron-regulated membrane protein